MKTVFVLLYPRTLIEELESFEQPTLISILRTWAGAPGERARFVKVMGIFTTEEAARLAAEADYMKRDIRAMFGFEYSIEEFDIGVFGQSLGFSS